MTLATLEQAVPEGDRILLDSSTLIAHLNGGEAVSPVAHHIINSWVRTGRNEAVVSVVSTMEVLVQPLRLGPGEPFHTALDFLMHFPHIRLVPLDVHMAIEAASLRVTYNYRPPDALTIATGIATQVSHLVTNDDRWQKLRGIAQRVRVCYLDSHLPFPK